MDKEELKEKFKSGMDKFVESSKKALAQAGNAVQDFSDKSVIRIEKHQLESKKDEQLKKLGILAAEKFLNDESAVLSASEEAVVEILQEIRRLNGDISNREDKLKAEASDSQENA